MIQTILEILKFTIPGLIVFATIYYTLRNYLNSQYELKALEVKGSYSTQSIPLKLQAYERIILLCERIRIPNLLMRLRDKEMTKDDLKNAMIISVQKEFEHNMAQQLYCSGKLWDIIQLAKNDTIAIISDTASELGSDASPKEYSEKLISTLAQLKRTPTSVAIQAVKEEAKIILNV